MSDESKPALPPLPPRAQALREMIAAHALQGMLAAEPEGFDPEDAADEAVSYADALIRRLQQPT